MTNKTAFSIIVAIGIILAVIPTNVYAQNQPNPQPEKYWSTYEDPILSIKVQYPKGWEVEETPNDVNIDLHEDSHPIIFFTIGVTPTHPETDTSEKLMKLAMNTFRGSIEKTNEINDAVFVDNKPAYKVDYDRKHEDGIKPSRTIAYFLVTQDLTYTLSFIVMSDKYEEYNPIMQKMVNSFEILS